MRSLFALIKTNQYSIPQIAYHGSYAL